MIVDNLVLNQTDKISLLKAVLEKHHISREQFIYTRDHYKQNPEYWIRIYKKVQNRITEKKSL